MKLKILFWDSTSEGLLVKVVVTHTYKCSSILDSQHNVDNDDKIIHIFLLIFFIQV